ncbi:MAG: twin-arginine translocation signal domain-containing protein, partial [Planctomycetota bacterium]
MRTNKQNVTRRSFLKAGAAISAGAMLSPTSKTFARGSDTMRVALIGCGSRGTGDAIDCLASADGVEMVAMADLFRDKLDS